jgi:hypothetical protein
MTRLEKCKLFEEKGFKYNPETGDVTGPRGVIVTGKSSRGYLYLGIWIGDKKIKLMGHQFAWWIMYKECREDLILDHIDRNKLNNKISNLRLVTNQVNAFNQSNRKGYSKNKKGDFIVRLYSTVGGIKKSIFYKKCKTEQEAIDTYQMAKEKYHII